MRRPYRGRKRCARPASNSAYARHGWFIARVHGQSMRPTLADGDLLLVDRSGRVVRGSLVVVRLPDGTVAVKRAAYPEPTGWWVERDNPRVGIDSWTVGAVPHHDVLGVVVARGWPRPARFVAGPPAR